MKLLCFIAALLSFAHTTLAAADPQPASTSSLLNKRASTDTCANLRVRDSQLGFLYGCFCVSGVTSYVNTRFFLRSPSQRAVLMTRLTDLISTNGQVCSYPDNAIPMCRPNLPCSFRCSSGFVANQATRQCECSGPNRVECNGRCRFGRTCSSQFIFKRDYRCPDGHELCGVRSPRGRSSEGWECLDTKLTLESCGGCIYPFGNRVATGRDCSAVQGVNTVSCLEGKCLVMSCRTGYTVSSDGTNCSSIEGFRQQKHSEIELNF